MNKKEKIIRSFEKTIANLAKKSASLEANSACAYFSYQQQEPQSVKKLRRF